MFWGMVVMWRWLGKMTRIKTCGVVERRSYCLVIKD
jgi:hypothetical protein